jgi:hypothetical protein
VLTTLMIRRLAERRQRLDALSERRVLVRRFRAALLSAR